MTYDADGLRSTKTVGTRKFEYQYVGDKLYYEKRGDNQEFYYFYDSYGKLAAIYYTLVDSTGTSSAVYYVQTNSFGDVLRLYNSSAQVVANYEYDAWGNTLSVTDANGNPITTWYHIANSNPIRYRGYYYDSDLGLYYLQSRYYDAEIGRFINADSEISGVGGDVQGHNMYSYCMNNPVNCIDSSGMWTVSIMITANGNAFYGMAGSLMVSYDLEGNYEYQYSYIVPGVDDTISFGVLDIGIGIGLQITNAPTVYDMHGLGSSIGLGAGLHEYATFDILSLSSVEDTLNRTGTDLYGAQISVGYGVGLDIHANQSMTNPLMKKTTTAEAVELILEIISTVPFVNNGGL